MSNRNMF